MITTQPHNPSTDSRRPAASSGRWIRTPCCLPRVSRPKAKPAQKNGTRRRRCGRRGGRARRPRGARAAGRALGRMGAAEGTRGNVGASRAIGAGPADGRPGRPRVLPDANACSWPDGGAGGGDRVCFRRVSPVSPVPEPPVHVSLANRRLFLSTGLSKLHAASRVPRDLFKRGRQPSQARPRCRGQPLQGDAASGGKRQPASQHQRSSTFDGDREALRADAPLDVVEITTWQRSR